ncbi:glycosyltransferase [Flavobacteriaceae bacterium GSB9]|nr:glycosyltransferase [Flavobacteriaceae bacterium GSB9]
MLISIITINYNNVKGLKHTFDSVFNQTFGDFEYIVIDGNSTDGSKELIEVNKDRLSYWVSEPDTGIYNAMNKGIKKATGDYLLFLNSGDLFVNDQALETFVSYNPKEDILYGNITVVDKNKEWVKTYPKKLTFGYLKIDSLPHPASLIKRHCFDDYIYDESLNIVSDWKFFIVGICKKGFSYRYVNEVISVFNYDGMSSLLSNKHLIDKERKEVLVKEFATFLEDYKKLNRLEQLVHTLRKSKKIQWMVKLRLINKF